MSLNEDFLKPYDFKDNEDKIYQNWEKSGFFNPDNLPGIRHTDADSRPFCVVIPPPNVTGSLHMGHALNATIQDILIRYKRMKGFKTLWIPGTDHAGIATQNVVEKNLKKEGISRHDLGREKFLEKVWEWKEKYGDIILNQLKKIGASCDWSRTRFTMDEGYAKAVSEAFLHYYKKGWIYQGDRVVNWCTRDATSLSDLELEYKEEEGKLYYIKYPLKSVYGIRNTKPDFVIVATTRPETMLGDSAVAVNPEDEKYRDLIGKNVTLPILNREIPIVEDMAVEKEFGTGAVKVTPAHDFTDAEIGERHDLPKYQVIDEKGRMTDLAGEEFEGLKVLEAREKVVEKLKELGLLEKEENYIHSVAHCYRCDTVIEPLISKQWFLKMSDLGRMAYQAVENGDVKFHPERWSKVYLDWLSKVKDWCISRQIWWGHKIPIDGSTDVLDTWFSSALWPLVTLGWPDKTKDLEVFYPTSVLSTARDIINLWVARMVFSGLEFENKKPFSDVIIHATILAKDGRRMSKSLGTGVDPMGLIEKHGADATRFGIIWQAMGGQDIKWADEHVLAGQKFSNKLWNITRFILTKVGDDFDFSKPDNISDPTSKELIEKFEKLLEQSEKQIEIYEFGQALHDIYEFVWHEFADKYIEYSKNKEDKETKQVLCYVLIKSIKLLHPFMPFVTEAIYQRLPKKDKEFLMIEEW
ncbi:MAG: valine--tRNA ligase [Candidatus Paceibacterota bacterium]|jgi:valyl-tRNA synthetase